ncbi:MAG TPA: glycine betaine ABC transporter substrate-binding protein [Gemmatimonadales bacterium]|nr:glycine betaine ABC transporter substrate-binding protein [Gemmatimonadales bacterium]
MTWLLAAMSAGLAPQAPPAPARPVVVASKPFAESYLLAEMFAQLLEARGYAVDRRPGLGATEVAFGALRAGAIDVYPEYTGTGLIAILGERPAADPAAVYARVAAAFRERWGIRWLPPLGFENTYAIAVRRATAERYGLRTLSDLARVGGALTAGLTPDFVGRADGLPGLARAYGLRFEAVRPLVPAVKYQALAEGAVDVIDGYSTDGQIARYDLVVLADDRHFFPAYEAAALVGADLARTSPGAALALTELSGRLDVRRMRELNRRVEVDREPVAAVARDALAGLGLAGLGLAGGARAPAASRAASQSRPPSLLAYMLERRALLARLTLRHLLLVAGSLAAGIALALPLGLLLARVPRPAGAVLGAVGLLQTIPSLALLAFMLPLLGIGVVPALVALFLYSLYPILRNTYAGVRAADPVAAEAALSLGMTPGQVLRWVRLPLAAPVIMAGIRTAAVIGVGTATLAALIGAGGLGDPIVAGLALADARMILSGAIPAALLALVVDAGLGWMERRVTPRGVRG